VGERRCAHIARNLLPEVSADVDLAIAQLRLNHSNGLDPRLIGTSASAYPLENVCRIEGMFDVIDLRS